MTDAFQRVRALARHLPGVEESTSYGTPALKWRRRLLARLHQDGKSLVVRTELFERELLLAADPKVFFITAHYEDHPWVLVNLAKVKPAALQELLETAYAIAGGTRPARRSARR